MCESNLYTYVYNLYGDILPPSMDSKKIFSVPQLINLVFRPKITNKQESSSLYFCQVTEVDEYMVIDIKML